MAKVIISDPKFHTSFGGSNDRTIYIQERCTIKIKVVGKARSIKSNDFLTKKLNSSDWYHLNKICNKNKIEIIIVA